MINVDGRRINDPDTFSLPEIADACEKHGELVVQFTEAVAYSPPLLEVLNEACGLFQSRLQVRFYWHQDEVFDARVLRHLPEVRNLSLDCLSQIAHEDEIGRLPKLERLHFGVFEFDRPDFLNSLRLGALERLSLAENRKRNFDLAPVKHCVSLRDFFVQGHARNIGAIVDLPQLSKLTLSAFAKKHALDFAGAIPNLKELMLIIGGRTDIDDLSSASIEVLQILRVRGLTTLGDLSRFPALSALRLEDQLQLTSLDLGGADLERLSLANCKNLTELQGLDRQRRLREFSASQVALDMNALLERDWPESMRSVRLFTNSLKWNDAAAMHLAGRKLGEAGSEWM